MIYIRAERVHSAEKKTDYDLHLNLVTISRTSGRLPLLISLLYTFTHKLCFFLLLFSNCIFLYQHTVDALDVRLIQNTFFHNNHHVYKYKYIHISSSFVC